MNTTAPFRTVAYRYGTHIFYHDRYGATQALVSLRSYARLLLQTLLDYRAQGKYLLHEFVIMPDHVHLLITPGENLSLERAVQFIKGGFSFRLRSKFPVWQESFTNHRIRDEEAWNIIGNTSA
jgi:putative transposase